MASSFLLPLSSFTSLLLLVLPLLSTTLLVMSQPQKPSDTDALTIFRSRADAHGNLAANWSTPDACSGRWLGVGCSSSSSGGRVTSLSLPSLDLRGPLDPLSHLDQLRRLDLHANRLNGTLLPLLPSLPNLKLLYLSGNDLSGDIPPSVGNLTRLLRLDLSDNNLHGPVPGELFSLTRLLTLRLQNNLLTGPLPDLSSALPRLLEFNASNNQLFGRVPDGLLAKFGPASIAGNAGLCGPAPTLPLCSVEPPQRPLPSSPASSSSQSVVPSNPSAMPGSLAARGAGEKGGRGDREVLTRGAIIGIIVGNAVFLLMLLALFLGCCCSWHLGAANNSKVEEGEMRISGDPYSLQEEMKKKKRSNGTQARGSDESEEGVTSAAAAASPQSKMVFFEEEHSNGHSDSSGGGRRRRPLKQFGLEELLRASAEMVGKGSLGTVYRAVLEDGRVMAVKRLRDANPCSRKEFHRYMDLIGRLRHPNLVPLRAYYFANQEKLLIYDFLPNGSLHSLLHGNRGSGRIPVDWTTRISLVLGAARGLARIHEEYSSSGIPHGNVRSSNVLLDKNGMARISDFGLALLLSPAHATARLGGYMAPEQADGGSRRLSQEADVYGFGVLLLEVLTGRAPSPLCPPPLPPPKKKVVGGATAGGVGGVGVGVGASLPEWVRSVVREEWTAEVFDPELMRYKNVEEEMVAMLHVGLACVAQQAGLRPTMAEVVRMIEDIRVEQSPLAGEEDGEGNRASLSPSLAATTEDGRLSYVTDC